MGQIFCPKCSVELTSKNSYPRKDGKPRCKNCQSIQRVESFIRKKIWAVEYMGGKCIDCLKVYPYQVFSFHHLDPSEKDHDWETLRKQRDETVKRELSKCVLLCMNCHAIRHIDLTKDAERIKNNGFKKPIEPKHGLASTYNHHKCRCVECVTAHREKILNYRRSKKVVGPMGLEPTSI